MKTKTMKITGIIVTLVMLVAMLGIFSVAASETESDAVASLTVGETDPTEHKTFDEHFRCVDCGNYDEPELSESGYYLISTPSQLFWFAEYVNAGNGNVMAFIENDIDLCGVEWTPIGTANNPFRGCITGENGGSVIKGLNVVATESYAGFIGNMDITDSTLSSHGVDNLIVYGEITIEEDNVGFVGGIAGYSNAMIRRCNSYVNITKSEDITITSSVGGIVGSTCDDMNVNDIAIEISRCAYFGFIKLPDVRIVGGIIGDAFSNVKIYDCANYGSIEASSLVGGIVGSMEGAKVYNCLNVGEVVGVNYFGAIIGYVQGSENTVTNNYYLDSSCDYGIGSGTGEAAAVTAEQLASGEVTWLLNGESTSGYWLQDIDYYKPEAYPQISDSYYVYYTTACDGEGMAYTNYINGQLHISDGTGACVNCGAEVFIVIDGVAYYNGGNITNTGLDIEQLWSQNLDYNKMYFKAGEGYALLTFEDFETEFAGGVKKYERKRVLTLNNATIDLREGENGTAITQNTSLKIVFEGENKIYSSSGIHFSGSDAEADALVLEGRGEGAVLNFYGDGGSLYYYDSSRAINVGVIVLESGTVNTINTSNENTWVTRAQSLLYVKEGASFNVVGGYFIVGDYMSVAYKGVELVNVEGELNAIALTANILPNTEIEFAFDVYGNATYFGEFLLPDEVIEGATVTYTLNIPEGATLTVPEGKELNIQSYDSTNVKGTIAGEYTCDHRGGVYSCTVGYICDFCNAEYTEPRGHEMNPWSWNETEHYRECYQCNEYIETEEHDFSEWEHSESRYFHDRSCSVCDYSESAEHIYVWEDLGEEHKGTCQDCKYELTEGHHSYTNYRPIDADTHVLTCGGCQLDVVEGHQYSIFEKVDDETHKKYCYNCNFEVVENHRYVYYQPNGDGDCLNRGTMTGHCDGFCGMEHTMEDDSTGNGHDFDDWTCDEENPELHYSVCGNSGCDRVESREHSFGAWEVDYEPTATEDGLEYRICGDCDYEEERSIPAIGDAPDTDDLDTDDPNTDDSDTDDPDTDAPDTDDSDDPDLDTDDPDNTPDDPSDDKGGLGTGAIIAIVVAAVAVIGGGGFAFFWFVIRKKKF